MHATYVHYVRDLGLGFPQWYMVDVVLAGILDTTSCFKDFETAY